MPACPADALHLPCSASSCSASVRLQDLQQVSSLPGGATKCTAIDACWLAESAVLMAMAQRSSDGASARALYAVTAAGHAAEIVLDDDEVCQLAPEIDGAVVLGERSWSLLRDVPACVRRVRTIGVGKLGVIAT
jgi:hypothetical protein